MGQRVVDIPRSVSTELRREGMGAPVGGRGCTLLRPGAEERGAVPNERAAITS